MHDDEARQVQSSLLEIAGSKLILCKITKIGM